MIMTVSSLNKLNLQPANLYEEVSQNVAMILMTLKGTVPYYRNFGISQSVIDQPILTARTKLSAEIVTAIKRYEPRAKVLDITFEGDLQGTLSCKVIIEI